MEYNSGYEDCRRGQQVKHLECVGGETDGSGANSNLLKGPDRRIVAVAWRHIQVLSDHSHSISRIAALETHVRVARRLLPDCRRRRQLGDPIQIELLKKIQAEQVGRGLIFNGSIQ